MRPAPWWSRWWPLKARAPADAARWVVLDVESSGLDPRRDALLAIAAVGVRFDAGHGRPHVALADSFEVVLQRERPHTDKDNILLHGIGVGAQRAGMPAAEALQAFERWADGAPLVAYHAAFDEAMIGRAMREALGRALAQPWIDLAPVATALHPEVGGQALDDWLAAFHIDCAVRHQAAADTLATAELLLRLWPTARARGCASYRGLRALARQARWLRSGG